MLTKNQVEIKNDPFRGGIQITSHALTNDVSDVGYLSISRKMTGTFDWSSLHTMKISSANDFNFSCFDITAKSGYEYEYVIDIIGSDGASILEFWVSDAVKCSFRGLFVGDDNKQYMAGVNFKTETKMNTQVEYVTTLSGKYPYRIQNAETNYVTGVSSGLFLKLSDDKKRFVPDYNHSYSDEVLRFLCDGNSKIIKTHDGQGWYVSIDANASKVYSDFEGMNSISFNWTQISDLPPLGVVFD